MKLTGKQIFVFIEKAIGIGAVLFSCTMFIYERGAKDQVKNESTLLLQKTVRHADSISELTRSEQAKFIDQLNQDRNINAQQTEHIKKITNSVQALAIKILTKDELINFIKPYIDQQSNQLLIPQPSKKWIITGHQKDSI
jgi:hypothetical protein